MPDMNTAMRSEAARRMGLSDQQFDEVVQQLTEKFPAGVPVTTRQGNGTIFIPILHLLEV